MTRPPSLILEFFAPEFLKTPPKKLKVEENEGTNRTYVLDGDRIVAVALAPSSAQPA